MDDLGQTVKHFIVVDGLHRTVQDNAEERVIGFSHVNVSDQQSCNSFMERLTYRGFEQAHLLLVTVSAVVRCETLYGRPYHPRLLESIVVAGPGHGATLVYNQRVRSEFLEEGGSGKRKRDLLPSVSLIATSLATPQKQEALDTNVALSRSMRFT